MTETEITKNSENLVASDTFSAEAITTVEVLEEISPSKPSNHKKILDRAVFFVIFLHICLLPFLFGGVHDNVILPFRATSAFVLIFVLIFDYTNLKNSFSYFPTSLRFFHLLAACFIYTCLHSIAYQYAFKLSALHPVLGNWHAGVRPLATLSQLIEFGNYLVLFALVTYCSHNSHCDKGDSKISTYAQIDFWSKLIITAGTLVSLTALAHWFYDNGKLFWTFAPNYDSSSNRARWPFVNPNHLAIFLAIPYFLTLSKLEDTIREIKQSATDSLRRGQVQLGEFLSKKSTQIQIRGILISSSLLLSISLAIIGSLSRNAGLTIFIFTIIYYLLPRKAQISRPFKTTQNITDSSTHLGRIKIRRERRKSISRNFELVNLDTYLSSLKIIFKIGVLLAGIWGLSFFLGERGGELFKARIEYALLYTQDDMRWQMYSDSLPMIFDYYWMGIGLGNWSALYSSYMSVGLSGMEPAYLHSDILQFFIELGLLGFVLFTIALLFWFWMLLKRPKIEHDYKIRIYTLGLATGVAAALASASFEFPLRIPAITSLFVISLALGCVFVSLNKRLKR